ncbi:MAG: glycosyltransferase family 4 protein [Verrucomicrobia bacterium]|nr:glycosyltransferase family 4 protein [Verrucomicrobiota bacterium]
MPRRLPEERAPAVHQPGTTAKHHNHLAANVADDAPKSFSAPGSNPGVPAPRRKLRIGIVTVSYLPRLGGAVTQTLLLHKFLTARGHHVEVFCPDITKGGQFNEEGILVNRVHNRFLTSYDGTLARLAILREFRRAVLRRRADFDVFFTPEFNLGPLSLSLAPGTRAAGTYGADLTFEFLNLKRTDSIVTYDRVLRGKLAELGFVDWFFDTGLYALQRFMFRRLACVITLNPADHARIAPHARRAASIGCVLVPPPLTPDMEAKPRPAPRVATIIGRAVSWKRIDESIRVAERLRGVWPDLEIHYFGTGPLLGHLERQFAGRFTLHRDLKNPQVLEWLARSDVTVNMSDYETFCLTNCEAMLSRSLLLVKPLPEYADYIRGNENCILVPAVDAPGWLDAVRSAFAGGQVRGMLDAARRTIVEKYSVERTGAQIEKLLDELAGAG